jgi:hypothetical protein
MTDQEIEAAAAEVRRQLDEYMASADFEARANAACAAIQAGGLRTNAELADALGLPERFLSIAMEKQNKRFIADRGGLQ